MKEEIYMKNSIKELGSLLLLIIASCECLYLYITSLPIIACRLR